MRVFVNKQAVEILPGMTVRHALISAGFQGMLSEEVRVTDEWGNSIGMDGALDEDAKISVCKSSESVRPKDK